MNRAYSFLTVKAVEDDKRIIRGVATTPTVDRVGDIIEPLGVKFQNPLPLLWQHMHDKPVGQVRFDRATADGIGFEAELPVIEQAGALRDRIEEAWQSIRIGLVRAVSIGFMPIEYAFMKEGGIHFQQVEVFELSAVTIPANSEAVITAIKSIDRQLRAAQGVPEPEIPTRPAPAATGKTTRVVRLDVPARDRAEPFIIREIKRTT